MMNSSVATFLRKAADNGIAISCQTAIKGDAKEGRPTTSANQSRPSASPPPSERFKHSCVSKGIRVSKPKNVEFKEFKLRSVSAPEVLSAANELIKVVGDWDKPLMLGPIKIGTLKDSMWSDENYEATLAAQKLAESSPPHRMSPNGMKVGVATNVVKKEQPRGRGRGYYIEQDQEEFRAKYGSSAKMAAWGELSNTIQKEDAQVAAEVEEWKTNTTADDIKATVMQETFVERFEDSKKATGAKIVGVVGENGEHITIPVFEENYLSLPYVATGKPAKVDRENIKSGVNTFSMWMSEVGAYLNGREFTSTNTIVPSIWRILPFLFPNVKEMVVVLDTFTNGIPESGKLADVSGHRVSKMEAEKMEEIRKSFEKAGFKNVKLTFKVLVNEAGERDEVYLM
ncbi:uncharacterized protein PAC_07183 [Phialocephala subalpina]|uniref:Uncharacterized protein n=1 Tax=Phialocephala subalpina TaxID=576137 RepID=A0A1L7WWZ9_9HELO|nr:uncharacterized protein PAC_07183 [Phialocephala subalpina]